MERGLRTVSVLSLALLLGLTGAWAKGRWQQVENKPDCAVWNGAPHPQETVTWTGPCANGKAHGYGVEVWKYQRDGKWMTSQFEGTKRNGKIHGRGKYTRSNGTSYEGDFVNGTPHGRGLRIWVNGDRYEGDYVAGKRTGRAVYDWADGRRYEGDYVDGKLQGHGVYTSKNGDRCEGQWRSNKLVGTGSGWNEIRARVMKCRQLDRAIQWFD